MNVDVETAQQYWTGVKLQRGVCVCVPCAVMWSLLPFAHTLLNSEHSSQLRAKSASKLSLAPPPHPSPSFLLTSDTGSAPCSLTNLCWLLVTHCCLYSLIYWECILEILFTVISWFIFSLVFTLFPNIFFLECISFLSQPSSFFLPVLHQWFLLWKITEFVA